MALANIDSFQYLIKRYQKNKSGPEKKKKKRLRVLNYLIPGAQMVLEIFGLFQPLLINHACSQGMYVYCPMISIFVVENTQSTFRVRYKTHQQKVCKMEILSLPILNIFVCD